MTPVLLRGRLRSRRSRIIALVVIVLVIAGVIVGGVASSSGKVRVISQFVTGTPEGGTPVQLDTSLYLPDTTPAPAVLLSQGFGGDKSGLDSEARSFAERGFVVLTYTARGFGRSGGLIHFASPQYEVHDGELLIDHLAGLKQVAWRNGAPEIATAGASYGGALSLLIAAYDHRVKAVAADITWNDLSHALFPNAAGSQPGVFKKLWAGTLFGNAFTQLPSGLSGATGLSGAAASRARGAGLGAGTMQGPQGCGRFAASVCRAYQASAAAGEPNSAMTTLMQQASPASVLDRIDAPTLLSQGEQDSLFPLSEADANARGIAAHGTPVQVIWRPGGHDTGTSTPSDVISAAGTWFRQAFAGSTPKRPAFTYAEQAGVVSAQTGDATQQTLRANGYPGIDGTARQTRSVPVAGQPQTITSPAGGSPAVITSIPGLGGISGRFDRVVAGGLPGAPGQTATFVSRPVAHNLPIAGQSSVQITVTSASASTVDLFAGLRDLGSDGTETLPSQLVAPLRLTDLQPGVPRTVTVALPSFVRNILAGHRLVLTVSASDFSYAGSSAAQSFAISLPGNQTAVSVPTLRGSAVSAGHPFAWLIVGGAVCLLVAGAVAMVILRRRRVLSVRPDLRDVPVSIESLVKEYRGGYRAVDDVSCRVERGQVVGLLGPNGAGKTTTLRVLVGLITPTTGELHVFGEPIYPGAPVLARIGAFIEGPGFLPHLTGRENLRLYWAATGRPANEAEFDTALEIAGLGSSLDRRVRTYSHGMKQRLGIAQAMLGLPEVLVLDEPTNGLDPPQIAEMREMLQDYARTGRTVVVSSHLLAEVEQTCTHVVVMHRGRLVAAGSVAEIAGAGGQQLSLSDPGADPADAQRVLAAAGISTDLVPARRALEDVFLGLIGDDGD